MVVVTDGRAQGEVAWDLKKKREVELAELKSCYLHGVLLHTGRGSGLDRPDKTLSASLSTYRALLLRTAHFHRHTAERAWLSCQ
jgi:uncharacterized protein YciI